MGEVPILHVVTTDDVIAESGFAERAGGVMVALGTRGVIQLRAPATPARRLYELARALVVAGRAAHCRVVVNDRVDVALAAGAWGTQLTSRSLTIEEARAIAPRLAIGASVHTPEETAAAAESGAQWAVLGHVFATASHPNDPGHGHALIEAAVAQSSIPLIAIGGIKPEHVTGLRAAGAYGVAVIRGVWAAADPEGEARRYLSLYDEGGAGGQTA